MSELIDLLVFWPDRHLPLSLQDNYKKVLYINLNVYKAKYLKKTNYSLIIIIL